MNEIKRTVEHRRYSYGDYERQVLLRANLLDLIKAEYAHNHGGQEMIPLHEQCFWDLLNKITRIAVTPTHIDTWHDIQGYSFRVEEMLLRHQEEDING